MRIEILYFKPKKILKKYNLLETQNHLTNSKEILHLTLINYIDNLYYLHKDIPEDIVYIIKNNGTF